MERNTNKHCHESWQNKIFHLFCISKGKKTLCDLEYRCVFVHLWQVRVSLWVSRPLHLICLWPVCWGYWRLFFFPFLYFRQLEEKKSLFKSPTHSSTSDSDEALFSESVTAALCPGAEWATQQTQQWSFSSSHAAVLRHIMKSARWQMDFQNIQ